MTGKNDIMTPLVKQIIEASLECELDAHLDDRDTQGKINRPNGKPRKHVKSDSGHFELETPHDRAGIFEPELVKKRQTVLNESLNSKILALYSFGMSYQATQSHLQEIYDINVSASTINKVTNQLLPVITCHQPLPNRAVTISKLDVQFENRLNIELWINS